MNEEILKIVKDNEAHYPKMLEQQFPHILEKIILLWESPEFDTHINQLMLDKRDHHRHGFPPEVASEILRLSIIHNEQFANSQKKSWIDSSDIKID